MVISVLLMLANIALVLTIFFDTSKKTGARREETHRQQSALALARASSRPTFRFATGVPEDGLSGGLSDGDGDGDGDGGAIELTENPLAKQAREEREGGV